MWAWIHKLGSPPWFYRISAALLPWCAAVALLGLGIGLTWGLLFAPPDYQQGNSFRIIYLHVPAAILAQSCYLLMALAGAVGLIWRIRLADLVAASCAPIGASITVLALATGAIWGKPTWGTYWVWDARLTSMLVLLFLYLGVIALQDAVRDRVAAARASALLALVGLVNIPIIKYSVEWWNTLHQPATFRLTEKPAMPPEMWVPLLVSVLGLYGFFALVLLIRTRTLLLMQDRNKAWARPVIEQMLGSHDRAGQSTTGGSDAV